MLRALLLVPCLLLALGAQAAPTLQKVRLGQHEQETRVVLEFSGEVKPKAVFDLPNPNRLVLDFPQINIAKKALEQSYNKNTLITDIRSAQNKPGVVRVVMDLTSPAQSKVFTLPPTKGRGHRVVVDLLPSKKAATKQVAQARAPRSILSTVPPVPSAKTEPKGPLVVVIDPGHGGKDPGAIGRARNYEKHVVLSVGKKLRDELRGEDIKVVMTRSSDKFIPLRERMRIAQRHNADMFISIHADAHKKRSVRGGTVYVLSEKASDREAARLARNANKVITPGLDISHEAPDVQDILIDLTQRETMNRSALLGREVLEEFRKVAYLRKDHLLYAGFAVLKAPEVPSILVELAYLSNPDEERKLVDKAYQTKLAKSLAQGIRDYANRYH